MSLVENINNAINEQNLSKLDFSREKHDSNKIFSRVVFDYFLLGRSNEYLSSMEMKIKTDIEKKKGLFKFTREDSKKTREN